MGGKEGQEQIPASCVFRGPVDYGEGGGYCDLISFLFCPKPTDKVFTLTGHS